MECEKCKQFVRMCWDNEMLTTKKCLKCGCYFVLWGYFSQGTDSLVREKRDHHL